MLVCKDENWKEKWKLSYDPEQSRRSSLEDGLAPTKIYIPDCFGDVLILYIGFTDPPDFYTSYDWEEAVFDGPVDKDQAFVNFYHLLTYQENRYDKEHPPGRMKK